MFEVLDWHMDTKQDVKQGCLIRTTPKTVVDLPTPFRVAWAKDGQIRIGLVTSVNRQLSLVKLADLAPGDIVFLTISGWKSKDFDAQTLLYVRP